MASALPAFKARTPPAPRTSSSGCAARTRIRPAERSLARYGISEPSSIDRCVVAHGCSCPEFIRFARSDHVVEGWGQVRAPAEAIRPVTFEGADDEGEPGLSRLARQLCDPRAAGAARSLPEDEAGGAEPARFLRGGREEVRQIGPFGVLREKVGDERPLSLDREDGPAPD